MRGPIRRLSSVWSVIKPSTSVVAKKWMHLSFTLGKKWQSLLLLCILGKGTNGHCWILAWAKWLDGRATDWGEDRLGENLLEGLVVMELKTGMTAEFSKCDIWNTWKPSIHREMKEAVRHTHLELRCGVWAQDENVKAGPCQNCPDLVRQFPPRREPWPECQLGGLGDWPPTHRSSPRWRPCSQLRSTLGSRWVSPHADWTDLETPCQDSRHQICLLWSGSSLDRTTCLHFIRGLHFKWDGGKAVPLGRR